MPNLDVGVIGNCQIAALIDERANVVWSCMPQFDSDPVFCRLLRDQDDDQSPGFFDIDLINYDRSERRYETNTAILETRLFDGNGGAIRVTDLAPRYEYVGRMFTPVMLVRRIEPI